MSIDAGANLVREFLADPMNLPRWAVGFAKSVRRGDEGWVVATAGGDVGVAVDTVPAAGTVDFLLTPAPGIAAMAACRVLPRGAGAEVVFTQFQAATIPDEVFEQNIVTVAHELTVLKAILEVACPL